MLAPRIFSKRRAFLFLLLVGLLAGLVVVSSGLGEFCDEDGYCEIPGIRFGARRGPGDAAKKPPRRAGGRKTGPRRDCVDFPDTSDVLLVMKTGASESFGRVSNQILTNLKCLPDFLIFSDMAQDFAGYAIHDSLDAVLDEVRRNNSDFDLYNRQQRCAVDVGSCNKNHDVSQEAWNLDKYKNIHMAEKAFALRPDHEWYLFVDADTYVVWPTMMRWLRALNPDEAHYIGSVAYIGEVPFAHGGSGYLVSKAAMQKMFRGKTGVGNSWDERVAQECCGDYMFAIALKNETGVEVKNAWPTVNGEKPHTLPYAEDQWCQPIVTMHHVSAQEVSELWALEKERNFSAPLRIKDLYHEFVEEQLVPTRDAWDNMSDDVFYLNRSASDYSEYELSMAKEGRLSKLEQHAHQSFEDCRRVCKSIRSCLQYRFWNGICSTSKALKHGVPTKVEKEKWWEYRSGWDMTRIQKWVKSHGKCRKPQYPTSW
ncbi:glycosyltransferase family 31 protein [Drechmeria coniospora]|uniref:N-acetylgalactosaminide beta-1,3-galactosyltransferase n=1 Tax=Drechmeria coniospora TaxID=98403 RepID=A0A151GE16_DRECN|nr:glycosyltransferase family 31 protein [Drechmeria coniospora]KYK55337.1 glycosyltransferase family 31 protein [Drechmeria coniospora]